MQVRVHRIHIPYEKIDVTSPYPTFSYEDFLSYFSCILRMKKKAGGILVTYLKGENYYVRRKRKKEQKDRKDDHC